eukprot:TRINITY_DN6556_c0_g1_i1.p1 TRINITY_DN6556_c0_g1~~TRINITY_DN6556_c0_g1_i1.p1  ORF type:complete len:298 (-),score=63.51 TRINITY_DN6556_c0_g1_i1:177-1070(-)
MQERQLGQLNSLTRSEEQAIDFLKSHADRYGVNLRILDMLQNGIGIREKFLSHLLEAVASKEMRVMKNKARLFVRNGALLKGVLDETFTLSYGQVFIQYRRKNEEAQVMTGKVVVVKCPCLHLGDVLILEAVDVPDLRHLVNVVAFPARGPRPHPNETSGGDLDGDQFLCINDPALIPKCSPFEAMDYASPTPTIVDEVQLNDILQIFVKYIAMTILGELQMHIWLLRISVIRDQHQQNVLHWRINILGQWILLRRVFPHILDPMTFLDRTLTSWKSQIAELINQIRFWANFIDELP